MSQPDSEQKSTLNEEGAPIVSMNDGQTVSLYAAHKVIHPRTTKGVFTNWRWALVVLTQLVFYALPWMQWGERQMVLFDVAHRRFYLFASVLYPQDFIYLTGLLVMSALSLFLFTAVAGRLWCGFACPQTVYSEIFIWIERVIEGDRSARLRLDAGPWNVEKITKKLLKQVVWLLFAFWTGFTFIGYFMPIRELLAQLVHFDFGGWGLFWACFYGMLTYGNAGFMREQFCKYLCPYARFQSAMFDHDTLIVSYDAARGEPRGPRLKKLDYKAHQLGECIDCKLCIQVCPTGIDIRNGLQYECIGCGVCIDACDGVMEKMSYPKGLIRLTTQNGLANQWTGRQILRHVFRPRILVYGTILIVLASLALGSLVMRTPFKVNVVRDRAALARIVPGGKLENIYRLQIMNATEKTQTYKIEADGLDGLILASDDVITIKPAQAQLMVVRLQVPSGKLEAGSHKIYFKVETEHARAKVQEKSVFIVPERRNRQWSE